MWLDYQPNIYALPLFSERFKVIIENMLTGQEGIDWLSVKINGNNEQRVYYMMRFNKMNDVLDIDRSLFAKQTNSLIRPHFSFLKISKYTVFTTPGKHDLWRIPSAIYMSQKLKKIIKAEKLTGITFEKVQVSD